jgi:YHS domain-containing protein
MNSTRQIGGGLAFLLLAGISLSADRTASIRPKQALKPLHDLIGEWRGTGEPAGTREEKLKNFWTEKIRWEWRFKGDDAWLAGEFDKGKHYRSAEIRWLAKEEAYQLTLRPVAGAPETYSGKLERRRLTFERSAPTEQEGRRIILNLLHANRHLFRVETRAAGKSTFALAYQIGATKEGVPFAAGDSYPICIVSGGRGTLQVMHQGKTYYVCCTGCKDAFEDDPEKFIKEFEEQQKAERK